LKIKSKELIIGKPREMKLLSETKKTKNFIKSNFPKTQAF